MRILSGAQPSGQLHLGNYFGAIRQWIDLQAKGEGFFFIANLHALTTVRDPQILRDATFGTACDYLAMGLDPERCVLFAQHDVLGRREDHEGCREAEILEPLWRTAFPKVRVGTCQTDG